MEWTGFCGGAVGDRGGSGVGARGEGTTLFFPPFSAS